MIEGIFMGELFEVKLGFAPVRRNLFSAAEAVRYKEIVHTALKKMNINMVDINWLNEEGLLYNNADVDKVADYFTAKGVDAVFTPHCNFCSEDVVARLAKKVGKPLLLWGPRDDAPEPDGNRLRDSQCGLFATGKVLRRYGVPFTYIENCRVSDAVFSSGLADFIAAAGAVKAFKNLRIGQIDTRPQGFMTMIVDEGALLERFGIEVVPVNLQEILSDMDSILVKRGDFIAAEVKRIRARLDCIRANDANLEKMAALKQAIKEWAERESLSAVAFQCWNALQDQTGIAPCYINSELTEEFLPVSCETDIHGAVTSVITQALGRWTTPVFFADVTVRHPENDNGELLWHCGPFPLGLKKPGSAASISKHYILDSACPGVNECEIKGGDITVCRFDGDNGVYKLLGARCKGIDGPLSRGTYVWVEFENLPALEEKLVRGPYIHHIAGIHADITSALTEFVRYIPGLEPDLV